MLDFGRIEQLVKENHKSLSFLSASVLGKYRTFLRDVRDHNGKITDEQVSALAAALNTTPEYLKGETNIKEKATTVSGDDLSKIKQAMINWVVSTPDSEIEALYNFLQRNVTQTGDSQ